MLACLKVSSCRLGRGPRRVIAKRCREGYRGGSSRSGVATILGRAQGLLRGLEELDKGGGRLDESGVMVGMGVVGWVDDFSCQSELVRAGEYPIKGGSGR